MKPPSAKRVFSDRMTVHFQSNVRTAAGKRNGEVVWVRSDHCGSGGKPYTLRRMAIVNQGKVIGVARCDRRGRVYWHEPWTNETFVIEESGTMAALDDIAAERKRQLELAHGGDTEAFDKGNSRNDWIAYVNAYTGRAAQKVFRNERENQDFRQNMVKAAAICLAAIEAHDKGYC